MPIDPLAFAQNAALSNTSGIGDRLKTAAKSEDDAGLRKAAQQFEAYFIQEMLSSMRSSSKVTGGDNLLDSSASETWTEQLDLEVAQSISSGRGLGLASVIMKSMAAQARAHDRGTAAQVEGIDRAGWSWPLPEQGSISSGFGMRRHPTSGEHREHGGLDIAVPTGTPVLAASGGVVTHAGPAGSYGQMVELDHGDGIVTRYAHQSDITVTVGQKVRAGETVGAVGSTGASTGPHLHLEVRQDGEPLDPMDFLRGDRL